MTHLIIINFELLSKQHSSLQGQGFGSLRTESSMSSTTGTSAWAVPLTGKVGWSMQLFHWHGDFKLFLFSSSVLCWGAWETFCPPVQGTTWALKWVTLVSWLLYVHFFRPTCRPSQRWQERVPGSSTISQVGTVCRSHTWLLLILKHICLHWFGS